MPTKVPRVLVETRYYKAAQQYLHSLPLEHFMEATTQATQREITLESLALVRARRPEVQIFNELLVQYPRQGQRRLGQVVPDNMVVVHDEPIQAGGSFDVPLQPVRPLWMLEYVLKSNSRKDYKDNMRKYEDELKTPYYLIFDPDRQELTLYHHTGKRYASVRPDKHGRFAIAEPDVSVGLKDGWVRYWYQGKLLPLPAELQQTLDDTRKELAEANRNAEQANRRADAAEREAERLRAQLQELQARQKRNSS